MSASRSATHLDPRAPLVLDTRELGRRPGSMRRVQRTVPAPEGWALELVEVAVGADVELDLRLEAVMDGVLVSGTVEVPVDAECGRCLEPLTDRVVVDLQELYAYEAPRSDEAEDWAGALEGDFLDLEPVLRDAVVLGLPLNPVCAEDCAGLCPGCGEQLRGLPADHAHAGTDPRWAALAGVRDDDTTDTNAPPEIGS